MTEQQQMILTPPKLLTSDPGRVAVRAPALFAAMTDSWLAVQATMEARLLSVIQQRVESLLASDDSSSDEYSPDEESILALVDQFVDYVAEVQ